MISIVMDTSNQYLAVGIYKDGAFLDGVQKIGTKRQSEDAIPVLNDLIKKHYIDLLKVDEMIITKGPGSYTGVRVAMTIAKTLAAISDVKIKTVSSLAVYGMDDKTISIIDARSKKVFACVYDHGKPLMDEGLFTFDELAQLEKKYPDYILKGQLSVLGLPNKEVNLIEAMYQLGHKEKALENPDLLVPTYIKDVEAKKICY